MVLYVLCALGTLLSLVFITKYPSRYRRIMVSYHSTINSDTHTTLRAQAFRLVESPAEHDWSGFQAVATQAIDLSLPELTISFEAFIQRVTLIVTLASFLRIDLDVVDLREVILVTRRITQLWLLSKPSTPPPLSLLDELNHHLFRIIHDNIDCHVRDPLGFILPAWEPLWQVVAAAFAHAAHNDRFRLAFEDFNDHPTTIQLETHTYIPSVEAIILETIRLSPPIHHLTPTTSPPTQLPLSFHTAIWRQFFVQTIRNEVTDIAAIQRCSILGPAPDEFDPARHEPSRILPEQAETMLAFGYGPLKCVASNWAPMAAAGILAAILERVDNVTYECVVVADQPGGRNERESWVVRKVVRREGNGCSRDNPYA